MSNCWSKANVSPLAVHTLLRSGSSSFRIGLSVKKRKRATHVHPIHTIDPRLAIPCHYTSTLNCLLIVSCVLTTSSLLLLSVSTSCCAFPHPLSSCTPADSQPRPTASRFVPARRVLLFPPPHHLAIAYRGIWHWHLLSPSQAAGYSCSRLRSSDTSSDHYHRPQQPHRRSRAVRHSGLLYRSSCAALGLRQVHRTLFTESSHQRIPAQAPRLCALVSALYYTKDLKDLWPCVCAPPNHRGLGS